MKKTKKILTYELWGSVALAVLMAVLFESNLLLEGAFTGDDWAAAHLLTQMWMTVVTIFCIPIALKLFTLKYVHDRLTADESRAATALLRWGSLRMGLLCLPLVANVLCYYLFGADVRFCYLAVIDALALFFVYPSMERCRKETTND